MNNPKTPPGNWRIQKHSVYKNRKEIVSPDYPSSPGVALVVADVLNEHAHLIAAAPAMYKILEEIFIVLTGSMIKKRFSTSYKLDNKTIESLRNAADTVLKSARSEDV